MTTEKQETEPETVYQLMYDSPAGEYYVNYWTREEYDNDSDRIRWQEGHFSTVGFYLSREELDKAIDELRGEVRYAVFRNYLTGEVFITKEDGISGNWRGSKRSPANYVDDFATYEEAQALAKKLREK